MPAPKYQKKVPACCDQKVKQSCTDCDGVPGQPVWQENCPPGVCPKPCKGMSGWEIYQKFRSAVVRLTFETTLTTSTNPADRIGTALVYQTNVATLYMQTQGFFTKGHVIVAPAQAALLPPNTTELFNRYPFTVDAINVLANGQNMLRAGRVTADVFDVNGSGYSFTYQLRFLGVDGSGDLALFVIDRDAPWNAGLPCIKVCHPKLNFASSRKYAPGLPVYSFGDNNARSVLAYPVPPGTLSTAGGGKGVDPFASVAGSLSYIQGKVANNREIDYVGYAQQELIVVDFQVPAFRAGLPILDQYGHVVGMQTLSGTNGTPYVSAVGATIVGDSIQSVGDGLVAGPSSFFMIRAIKYLFKALNGCRSGFVTEVTDLEFGNYYSYTHGYLGLSWTNFTGKEYMSFVDANGFTEARYEADGVTLKVSPAKKEVIGLVVRGLAGQTAPLPIVVPGAATAGTIPGSFVDSPLIGRVSNGDIITHAFCCPLGGLGYQVPISFFTWRLLPGKTIDLVYRKLSDNFESLHPITVTLVPQPGYTNYPWYRYAFAATLLSNLNPPVVSPSIFQGSMPLIGGLSFVPSV